MKVSTYGHALASAISSLLVSHAVIAAQPWYELQIMLPSGPSAQVTTQLTGGWPLAIRAMAPTGAPTYSFDESSGPLALVASDPSGCFDALFSTDTGGACLSEAPDEVYTSPWIDLDAPGPRSNRISFAKLLCRVFIIDLVCPRCGGKMKIISVILDGSVIRKMLTHLKLSPDPPSLAPSRLSSFRMVEELLA